jgi:hypothetical protein
MSLVSKAVQHPAQGSAAVFVLKHYAVTLLHVLLVGQYEADESHGRNFWQTP